MDKKMFQVTLEGKTLSFPEGTTYGAIVETMTPELSYPVVLVKVNKRLRELHKTLKEDCEIVPVTTRDTIGLNAYKRSVTLMLLKAIYHVAGRENLEKVVLHYSMGAGYYFTVRGNVEITQAFLSTVKEYMMELVERKVPIMKRSINTDEAIRLFHEHGMYDKEKLFRYRRVSRVNLYSMDGFEDYYYGFMTLHTGYLKYFDLIPYDEGFILQLPTQSEPDKVPPVKVSPKMFKIQQQSEKMGRDAPY